ncbi:MAG: protein-methionine-sulfoxide reductase catalytic subunit MsrP [Myxococcota bacterium]|nr:protein-methionine-sulfoxide reductase catalytic subunit MsrP [Myxococcota bacterium]
MRIRTRRLPEPPGREITPEGVYLRRRELLRAGAGAAALGLLGCPVSSEGEAERPTPPGAAGPDDPRPDRIADLEPAPPRFRTDEERTEWEDATSYNNFYEFGTDKGDPKRHADRLDTEPWSVAIEGEVAKPGVVALEDLLRPHPIEERVYRLRCVEAWSMVIPWAGIPLGALLARFEPTSRAKYVAFQTLHDPDQMPGQRRAILDWPYREGLRIDEATHPLTILAVGMYGRWLPNQNGAPLRLVVPWKYGFKSIKSIVRIRLQETQPVTTWSQDAPREYGFYANVNPEVDHPRWSQARERRIGEWGKRDTLFLNGYAEQVASLYRGMDLRKHF